MVEIKNLVVRVVVANDATRRGASGSGGAASGGTPLTDDDRAALVEDCVRQVLAILERQTER